MTTAATAALAPEPMPGSGAGATADDTTTVHADFRRWERELAADSGCSHPIQLRHRTDMIDLATGELAPLYGTASAECGNRREAVCPACSATYKRDARQLVRAGLAGGKGIPGSIAVHPCVFATLTAPSFGPVHARRMRGKTVLPCRPRRDAKARQPLGRQAVANYIAKYTTKTLAVPGLPSLRLRREADLEQLRCPAHYRRMITTAWQLGPQFRAWAHMLGYGGHFLTKSRRYSVTFGQLRAARTEHRRATRPADADRDAWGRPLDETVVLVLGTIWSYAGIGRAAITSGAELALASADMARGHSPDRRFTVNPFLTPSRAT